MEKDFIGYQGLVQDALRQVVRAVLKRVAQEGGLPGGHHFYITFKTRASGVQMSDDLKLLYQDEMTIVLQHRFMDLVVNDVGFSVTLFFKGVPERLTVPFTSILRFYDPAVEFGCVFDVVLPPLLESVPMPPEGEDEDVGEDKDEEEDEDDDDEEDEDEDEDDQDEDKDEVAAAAPNTTTGADQGLEETQEAPKGREPQNSHDEGAEHRSEGSQESEGAQVVRLDVFRKK